ncbi:TadA family conjugal transfer-associated ATPase [Actinomadura harenae]|uniref:TadA family conjugal transfer-associated ATPase n=1 Tax=Actinomadura harenae TaxID=2483351 RepID=UPI001F437CA1|nr:TadA family conjugal transfer-associated ATPase [Actinomadura harenae]
MNGTFSEAVRGRLAEGGIEPTAGRVAAALRAEERLLGDREVLALADELRAEFVGAGPLEPLLRIPEVTDVLVNGPGEVWVDAGAGLVRTTTGFADEATLRRLAQRLTAAAGRRLDDASPYADARLPGGVRLHAVLPPVAPNGTCLSLRLPRRRAFTLDELVASATVPPEGAVLLGALVKARVAFLISGGTGTGKTTLLSCLLGLADPSERLLLVEDSAELSPDHPHVVRLETRPPNVEGAGGVTLHQLVRQALRMRPDRLVVGEVRGAEVVDLLGALNTGHEGGCGKLTELQREFFQVTGASAVPLLTSAPWSMKGTARGVLRGWRCVPSVGSLLRVTHGSRSGYWMLRVRLSSRSRCSSASCRPRTRLSRRSSRTETTCCCGGGGWRPSAFRGTGRLRSRDGTSLGGWRSRTSRRGRTGGERARLTPPMIGAWLGGGRRPGR